MWNIKTKHFLLSALPILFLIVSCSYPDSPKLVAEKFLEAFQQHDFKEAAKYGTPETGKLLKQIERIEELEKEEIPLPKGKIIIVSEETDGKTAIVFFKEMEAGEQVGLEEKLRMVKVKDKDSGDSEWRVALSKTDLKIPEPLFGPAVPDSVPVSSF
jgi:Domain of unknown function (DUF4878)